MKVFYDLGVKIDTQWRRNNYDIGLFPYLVRDILSTSNFSSFYIEQFCDWIINSANIPKQININSGFGQPPVTVFSNDYFYIEILFWLSGTPNIHRHGFRGGFLVLSGSSIHTTYQFNSSFRVNEHLHFGDLMINEMELLKSGDSRPILGGDNFIHSLFHLNHPSVSLVVRTYHDPENTTQYTYWPPHIAINPFHDDHHGVRIFQILRMLKSTNNQKFEALLFDFINKSNDYQLVEITIALINSNLIQEKQLDQFLHRLEIKNLELKQYIKPVLSEIKRVNIIKKLRNEIKDPDHRFFMALLIHSPNRQFIFDMMKRKHLSNDPIKIIEKTIWQLNGRLFGARLDEFQLDLVSSMIKTNSFEESLNKMQEKYDSNQITSRKTEIFKLYSEIKSQPTLNILCSD